ncbi:MAG TPA: adenosylcobinamide amidohydrolase [Methylomirabilota bacterium]|jgi:iron complex transport system ATP-binding protein|nr:adenosylcobinamide amidohydrolase [Methylomirabilota bacterium]
MIAGVTVDVNREAVWVRSHAPLHVVSSAFVGGELPTTRHILNMHWPHGHREGLDAELSAFARRLGITEAFVGLMTAAPTHRATPVTEAADGVTVTAIVTVAIGATVSAGTSPVEPWRPSTINTILLLDACLDAGAAVNGVITATEAKVGALGDARVLTPEGLPATGTVTDAVVVAWTGRGKRLPYLGPAATGGWLLARAVRRAVLEGITRG